MTLNLNRQLKDVQYQADKLISGTPEPEAIESFDNYCRELKEYIIHNVKEVDIVRLAQEIPEIHDVEDSKRKMSFIALIVLGLLTLGISALYLSYVANMRRTTLIQNNIQTARGKFASIEFLLKASS